MTLNVQGRVSVDGVPFTGTGHFKFALVGPAEAVDWGSASDTSPADGEPDTAVIEALRKRLAEVEALLSRFVDASTAANPR